MSLCQRLQGRCYQFPSVHNIYPTTRWNSTPRKPLPLKLHSCATIVPELVFWIWLWSNKSVRLVCGSHFFRTTHLIGPKEVQWSRDTSNMNKLWIRRYADWHEHVFFYVRTLPSSTVRRWSSCQITTYMFYLKHCSLTQPFHGRQVYCREPTFFFFYEHFFVKAAIPQDAALIVIRLWWMHTKPQRPGLLWGWGN